MSESINRFDGEYFFLSNFYSSPVKYNGRTYMNSEAAFQAQKCINEYEKAKFENINPSEAKKLGRRVKMRDDWENIKEVVMHQVCREKFKQNKQIGELLIKTGDCYIEEGNTWGDREWGTVNGNGKNMLGKILMKVRYELRNDLLNNQESR